MYANFLKSILRLVCWPAHALLVNVLSVFEKNTLQLLDGVF
jgi:hypothetical protein